MVSIFETIIFEKQFKNLIVHSNSDVIA